MDTTRLGPYRLSHCLGIGGMGQVWKAERNTRGDAVKQVAIKVLREDLDEVAELREMFLAEAHQAMRINNANVVQVFDADETDDGRCYMVMEFVDGLDLSVLNKRMREAGEAMPLRLSAYIIGELLKALACIHEFGDGSADRGLVHRDLTPDNVMLSVWGEVKIMDFGIAHLSTDDTEEDYAPGKLRYMAPEQLHGDGCKPTIDMFALGAILHELLDGRPFRAGIEMRVLHDMVAEGRVSELCEPARVPRTLALLRADLLAPEADARVPSARAAYKRLAQWPDYRDARFELEALIRRFAKDPDEVQDSPSASGGPETSDRAQGSRTSVSESDLEPLAQASTTPAPRPARHRRPLLLALGLMLVTGLLTFAVLVVVLDRIPPKRQTVPASPSERSGEGERPRWAPWQLEPFRHERPASLELHPDLELEPEPEPEPEPADDPQLVLDPDDLELLPP